MGVVQVCDEVDDVGMEGIQLVPPPSAEITQPIFYPLSWIRIQLVKLISVLQLFEELIILKYQIS